MLSEVGRSTKATSKLSYRKKLFVCYKLNVCVCPNFYVEALILNVMEFGDGG